MMAMLREVEHSQAPLALIDGFLKFEATRSAQNQTLNHQHRRKTSGLGSCWRPCSAFHQSAVFKAVPLLTLRTNEALYFI